VVVLVVFLVAVAVMQMLVVDVVEAPGGGLDALL
jgi:hypothetical protein